jgi:hypothetical protein
MVSEGRLQDKRGQLGSVEGRTWGLTTCRLSSMVYAMIFVIVMLNIPCAGWDIPDGSSDLSRLNPSGPRWRPRCNCICIVLW